MTTKWLETKNEQLTPELIEEILEEINDDAWVTAACAERVLDDPEISQVLVKTALRRSARVTESIKGALVSYEQLESQPEAQDAPLASYFKAHERERRVCILRKLLLDRLDRIQTYMLISSNWKATGDNENQSDSDEDPWADPEDTPDTEFEPPFTLSDFLLQPLVESAIILASEQQFSALRLLFNYHGHVLFPYRYSILDSIPLHSHPSQYHELLPANDFDTNMEVQSSYIVWRESKDWVEHDDVSAALLATMSPEESGWQEEPEDDDEFPRSRQENLLNAEELAAWYTSRVHTTDAQSGLLDNALELLQHGASQGVPGLDELGEDLILLDRLIYDTTHPEDPSLQIDWSLGRWKGTEPFGIIQAYLAFSTYDSISDDIRRLVFPYLSVLEARAERSKNPDPSLSTRLLYRYILQSPLELTVAIFESSKADIQRSYRIIRTDEDVARVALAYLYGHDNLTEWPLMSRIFECQPDWGEERDDDDEAFTTLASLAAFVTPSATQGVPNSHELLLFFNPLPASALSRLLDVLDTHLEAGEILEQWDVPAPLRWFLQSGTDMGQQRAWATRMSRRAGNEGFKLEDEDEWRRLLDAMLKLTSTGNGGLKSAFGLLSPEEVSKIFFTGLLSSGNFAVAKKILVRSTGTKYLTTPVVEEICLAVSRELYDNASSGNLHRGEMKLAYECLAVAPPTSQIQKEREFIEATSRICSFNVHSRPGIPISPLEIRLTKDRLKLIASVLSSTADAYKHSDVILDLKNKLGYRGDDAAEVKVLAMLVEVALQYEDFVMAETTCERMVELARTLRQTSRSTNGTPSIKDPIATSQEEAVEVAWKSCYQLGRHSEYPDRHKKLRLLGFALELCPTENTLDILNNWRRIEADEIEERRARNQARLQSARPSGKRKREEPPSSASSTTETFLGGLRGLSRTQDTAASMLGRVASNFPFSTKEREHSTEGRRSRDFAQLFQSDAPLTPDVAATARHALARGVGWLIGAEETEDTHKLQ